MMCEHPFIREKPYPGWSSRDMDKRLAATPLPCGRCRPCRINKRRMLTLRILLENSVHNDSIFSTFTFNDENLPDGVYPLVIKNLLQRIRRRLEHGFRYFAVGEYGDRSWRPHYHAILFGVAEVEKGRIDAAWNYKRDPVGFTYHLPVNEQVAAYIAGYTLKKLTKEGDPFLHGRPPEFMRSSRRSPGGIGIEAIQKIANKLNNNQFWEPQVITELKFGKKCYPLGQYLSTKLAQFTNVPDEVIKRKLWDYQEGIFSKHFDLKGFYSLNILDEKEQNREQQRKRMNIYKRRAMI